MQAVSIPTVDSWINRWRQGGVEELADKPRSGRPLKADEAYTLLLGEVIEKDPKELGYDFRVWTIDRLRTHLEKETGIDLSESRFRALLIRKGYRYRRPKHDLSYLQDKEAKAKAEGLKKGPPRRFRTHLCGRNDADPRSTAVGPLDESWTAKAYSGNPTWDQTETTCVWWL